MANAAPFAGRSIVRTPDMCDVDLVDTVTWYAAESVDLAVYPWRCGKPVEIPETASACWIVADEAGTNWIARQAAGISSNFAAFRLDAGEGALPEGHDYTGFVTLLEGTNVLGVLDRHAVRVIWQPDSATVPVGPVTNAIAALSAQVAALAAEIEEMELATNAAAIAEAVAQIETNTAAIAELQAATNGFANCIRFAADTNGNRTAVKAGESPLIGVPGEWSISVGDGIAQGHHAAAFADGIAFGPFAFAAGWQANAMGAHATALGRRAASMHAGAFTWNGAPLGENEWYFDNGEGTFNVNPTNGAAGFFIGTNSLAALLAGVQPDMSGYATTGAVAEAIAAATNHAVEAANVRFSKPGHNGTDRLAVWRFTGIHDNTENFVLDAMTNNYHLIRGGAPMQPGTPSTNNWFYRARVTNGYSSAVAGYEWVPESDIRPDMEEYAKTNWVAEYVAEHGGGGGSGWEPTTRIVTETNATVLPGDYLIWMDGSALSGEDDRQVLDLPDMDAEAQTIVVRHLGNAADAYLRRATAEATNTYLLSGDGAAVAADWLGAKTNWYWRQAY